MTFSIFDSVKKFIGAQDSQMEEHIRSTKEDIDEKMKGEFEKVSEQRKALKEKHQLEKEEVKADLLRRSEETDREKILFDTQIAEEQKKLSQDQENFEKCLLERKLSHELEMQEAHEKLDRRIASKQDSKNMKTSTEKMFEADEKSTSEESSSEDLSPSTSPMPSTTLKPVHSPKLDKRKGYGHDYGKSYGSGYGKDYGS